MVFEACYLEENFSPAEALCFDNEEGTSCAATNCVLNATEPRGI